MLRTLSKKNYNISTVWLYSRLYVCTKRYHQNKTRLCGYDSSKIYSRLGWGGGVPARAHSNREWQSNKIECSNSDLVPKTGLNFARKQLYARSDVRQCVGRGLPPYLSLLKLLFVASSYCLCFRGILQYIRDVHRRNYTSLYVVDINQHCSVQRLHPP